MGVSLPPFTLARGLSVVDIRTEEVQPTWTSIISAPASARATAIACPIPLVPPVTRAVFPWSENSEDIGVEAAIVLTLEYATEEFEVGM